MQLSWNKIWLAVIFISSSDLVFSQDYDDVEFVTQAASAQVIQNQPVLKHSSPSRPSPSPSRPSPSRPSPSRPASRPSPTSRPATRPSPSPTSRPATQPSRSSTNRPAPASTHKPTAHTTARPASPTSTHRPSPPSTHRSQSPSTYRPYTTQRSVASPPTSRPYTNSWTTHRPSQPAWTPAQSRTLAPPLGFTTGRPAPWIQGESSFQQKPNSGGGLSSLFKGLTGSGGSSGSGMGLAQRPVTGPPSKMAKVKQLATALYGAYKARQLKQKVSRNQYHTYSPYYGRNYYYGNRYYRNTNPGYRMTCYYYVPSNDPTFDLYYEDQNRVTEIVYECDARYERCCGTVDCCRGTYAVNGRGMGTGQSIYVDDRGMGAGQSVYPDNRSYQGAGQGVHTDDQEQYSKPEDTGVVNNPPTSSPETVDESNPQVYEVYAENYNFANLSDEDFVSFNETIYAADNETWLIVNYFENYTRSFSDSNGKVQKIL